MAINDFRVFATEVGANVMLQADYVAAAFRLTGFEPGIAQSEQLNKVWRQSAFVSAALAQFIANETGGDVLDDGDLNAMVASIVAAVTVTAGVRPARKITTSTPVAVLLSDYAIGLNRIAAPAATDVQLPVGAQVGQEFRIEDLSANAFLFNISVIPPVGDNLAGLPGNFVMNINRQSAGFRFYGDNIWSIVQ